MKDQVPLRTFLTFYQLPTYIVIHLYLCSSNTRNDKTQPHITIPFLYRLSHAHVCLGEVCALLIPIENSHAID
jgi:hypothetical protein